MYAKLPSFNSATFTHASSVIESFSPKRRLAFGRSASRTVTAGFAAVKAIAVFAAAKAGYVGGRGPGSRNFTPPFGTPGSSTAWNFHAATGDSGDDTSFWAGAGSGAARRSE